MKFTGRLREMDSQAVEMLISSLDRLPSREELSSLGELLNETPAFNPKDRATILSGMTVAMLVARFLDTKDLRRQVEKA